MSQKRAHSPLPATLDVPAALESSLERMEPTRKRLARRAAASISDSVRRGPSGRSFADLLSRIYALADGLVTELEGHGDVNAVNKRAEALKSVAKTLPLLQAAERNARTMVKRKALEDMTDAEVEKAAIELLAAEGPDSPPGVK